MRAQSVATENFLDNQITQKAMTSYGIEPTWDSHDQTKLCLGNVQLTKTVRSVQISSICHRCQRLYGYRSYSSIREFLLIRNINDISARNGCNLLRVFVLDSRDAVNTA